MIENINEPNFIIWQYIESELSKYPTITRGDAIKGEWSPAKIASVLYNLTNKTDSEKAEIIGVSASLQRKWRTEAKCDEKYEFHLKEFTNHLYKRLINLSETNSNLFIGNHSIIPGAFISKPCDMPIKDFNPREFSVYSCRVVEMLTTKLSTLSRYGSEEPSSQTKSPKDAMSQAVLKNGYRDEQILMSLLFHMDMLYFDDCLTYYSPCHRQTVITQGAKRNAPLHRYIDNVMEFASLLFDEKDDSRKRELDAIVPSVVYLAQNRLKNFSTIR